MLNDCARCEIISREWDEAVESASLVTRVRRGVPYLRRYLRHIWGRHL